MKKQNIEPGAIVGYGITIISLLAAIIGSFFQPVSLVSRVIGLGLYSGVFFWLRLFVKDKINIKSDAIRILVMVIGLFILLGFGTGFLYGWII